MKQAAFRFDEPTQKTIAKKLDQYDSANLTSARIILNDPDRWGGPEAGLVQWAKAVVERVERTSDPARSRKL